jgi:hypothetical protein
MGGFYASFCSVPNVNKWISCGFSTELEAAQQRYDLLALGLHDAPLLNHPKEAYCMEVSEPMILPVLVSGN